MILRLTTVLAAVAMALGSSADATTTPLHGDDNHDGVVMEDESGWDCTTMGNLRCGR